MKLIHELIALNEGKKLPMYQIRFGTSPYEDVSLDIHSLETLHKEITANPSEMDSIKFKDIGVLNQYVLEYHGVSDKNPEVFDTTGEDYEVLSFTDDVLKVSYQFDVCYNKDRRGMKQDPRTIKGTVTLMPGN
jgi:hypothetical protein